MIRYFFIQFILILLFWPLSVNAQEYGYLKFDLNTDSATLIIDYDYKNIKSVSDNDSIKVSFGSHHINLSTPLKGQVNKNIYVYQDSTIVVRHNFLGNKLNIHSFDGNYAASQFFNASVIILTDQDSDIYYQNSYQGTGFAMINAIPFSSNNKITIENKFYGTKTVSTNAYPYLSVFEHYRRPKKSTSQFLSFVPGASQFYKKDFLKSGFFIAGTTGLVISGIFENHRYASEKNTFNRLLQRYNQASTEQEALRLGNLTQKQHNKLERANTRRQVIWGAALLLYGINIYDGLTSTPRDGFRKTKPISFYLSSDGRLSSKSFQTVTLRIDL